MIMLKKFNGWFRLFVWGVCPECNHDAPKLYDCPICEYYKYLPRYKSDQTSIQRNKLWEKFKKFNLKTTIMASRYRFSIIFLRQLGLAGSYLRKTLYIIFLCWTIQIDFSKGEMPLFKYENLFKS